MFIVNNGYAKWQGHFSWITYIKLIAFSNTIGARPLNNARLRSKDSWKSPKRWHTTNSKVAMTS